MAVLSCERWPAVIQEPDEVTNRRRREEMAEILAHLAPGLMVLLRSVSRRTGLCSTDLDDILQETFLRAIKALDKPGFRPANMRAWLCRVMLNCFYSHLRGRRALASLRHEDNARLVDPRTVLPELLAENREASTKSEQFMDDLRAWCERFLSTLDELQELLRERDRLDQIRRDVDHPHPPALKRRGGRPSEAQRARQIILDLPEQIAVVTAYLQRLT